jgi:hypothetical protein
MSQKSTTANQHQKFTQTLGQTPRKLNPKVNSGILFWSKFILLLGFVISLGLIVANFIPSPF